MDKPVSKKGTRVHLNTPDKTWVFDLDNTLYHSKCNLFGLIDQRMGRFLEDFLNLDPTEARRVQKDYFRRYGTTLNGLIKEHNANPVEFLDFVHDIDLSPVKPDPQLQKRLGQLRGRKYVFTNGDIPYATRVLERIGIGGAFDGIFDIAQADYVPKPMPETYRAFVNRFSIQPETTVMFEDMARNLVPASRLGMTTVWIKNASEWGDIDYEDDHIHYQAEYVTHWFDDHLEEAA